MEKISFKPEDEQEEVEFYVIEETKLNGCNYILVSESDEGDAEALILKDLSSTDDDEALYEIVTDDVELDAVATVFAELLEDIDIQR